MFNESDDQDGQRDNPASGKDQQSDGVIIATPSMTTLQLLRLVKALLK